MDLWLSAGMRTCCVFLLLVALIGCDSSNTDQQTSSTSSDSNQTESSASSSAPESNAAAITSENSAGDASAGTADDSTEQTTDPTTSAHAVDADAAEASHDKDESVAAADSIREEEGHSAAPDATGDQGSQQTTSNQRRPKLDWPEPKVVFVFSGRQHGYIEPCGCQTLAEQKGGLSRRHTLIRELAEQRGWTVVPLDVGDQVRRFGRQSEIKFQFTIEGLKKMKYRGIAFGPDDLHLSIDELAATTAQIGDQETPFISANVAVLDRDLTPRFKIIEANGMRIGVTSVLGDQAIEKLNVDEVLTEPAVSALKATWELLKAEQCDYHVLLAHATRAETEQLARAVPHFEVVVTADGSEIPPEKLEKIAPTESHLVEIGPKGMYVAVVGLFDDQTTPLRYELVPLNATFVDSREMLDLMANYQVQLRNLGFEGLGVRPLNHPSGRKFVGSEKCGECHTKAFAVWEGTPHAHATDSIVNPTERSEIPRHFDPECISCHMTGWNPQRFVPYESGYLSLEATPLMVGNGCENCHGPGSVHVAAESGELDLDEAAVKMLRNEMVLPLTEAENRCVECHDLDNSPDFRFQEYWDQVVHEGTD